MRALAFRTWFENEDEKKIFVLVGPPAIGKSTWIAQNVPDAYVVNRDDIVTQIAKGKGLTYDDMFASPPKDAEIGYQQAPYGVVINRPPELPDFLPEKLWNNVTDANNEVYEALNQRFAGAGQSGKDIVVDMTNMDVANRQRGFASIGDLPGYKKIAVVFNFQGSDVQKAVINLANKRSKEIAAQGGSKTIPEDVMQNMFSAYEPPTREEGFDEIINVDDRQRILAALQESCYWRQARS